VLNLPPRAFRCQPGLDSIWLGSGIAGDGLAGMVMVPGLPGLAELVSLFGQLQGRALPLVEALGVGPVDAGAGDAIEAATA